MQQTLVSYGPISIAVGAGGCSSFMNAGPTTTISCDPATPLDHAVLLVGYDQTRWIFKNSWNTWWGNQGYGYIDKVNNAGLLKYAFQLQVSLPWNPVPINPPPPPADSVTLTISMTDTYGDGWDGNVFGLKQGSTIVATFGAGFTTGTTYGPMDVTIPGNVSTQIVISTYGTWTEECGFVIKASNGTTIFTLLAGTRFSADAVFFVFCPTATCTQTGKINFYLALVDSYGDGWNGNVLAFRQNGTFQTFTLSSGAYAGPYVFSFLPTVAVDVVVNTLGSYTKECGFTLLSGTNNVAVQRAYGAFFYANSILGSFTPNLISLAPVS